MDKTAPRLLRAVPTGHNPAQPQQAQHMPPMWQQGWREGYDVGVHFGHRAGYMHGLLMNRAATAVLAFAAGGAAVELVHLLRGGL